MRFNMTSLWLCVSLSFSAQAAEVMTEQQLLHVFLQQNTELLLAKTALDAAEAEVMIARQFDNPSLSFSVAGLGNTPDWEGGKGYWDKPYEHEVAISQLIETAGKRQLRIESAQLAYEAEQLLFRDLLRLLTQELRTHYYDLVKHERIVALYQDVLQQLETISQANAIRLQVGDIAEVEYQRSQLEVLNTMTQIEEAHLALAMAQQALADWLAGAFPAEALTTTQQFLHDGQHPTIPTGEMLERAIEQRADVRAAMLHVEQQHKNLQLAQKLSIPDIELSAGYTRDLSAEAPHSANVGIEISLPLWHGYQGEIAVARADKKASDITLQQVRLQAKSQLLQAAKQYQQKQRSVQRFEQELVDKASQIRQSSVVAYQQGAISLLELMDAENNYRDTMLDYVEAQYELTEARLMLDYALGEDKE